MAVKLYKFSSTKKEYWETWQDVDGGHVIHWGELGTIGKNKTVFSSWFRKAELVVQKEMDGAIKLGFTPIEKFATLIVEYTVDGMGSTTDLDKRHRLQDHLDDTLGWTGLGHCDGGSIGSGSMEACCFVVDFQLAKEVISADLDGTEFSDFSRIYEEESD
jgi:hypothetical protein